jgi:hypothetical protein
MQRVVAGMAGTATAAAAAACAMPSGAGEKPAATSAPAVAKVLLMNNPVFTAVQRELADAQAEIDRG